MIVFDHANACASMHSLVEIHNKLPSIRLGRTTQFSPTHMVGLHDTSRSSSLTPISLRVGNPYFKIKCWKGACEFKEFHFLNNYKPISWVTRIWVVTFISHDFLKALTCLHLVWIQVQTFFKLIKIIKFLTKKFVLRPLLWSASSKEYMYRVCGVLLHKKGEQSWSSEGEFCKFLFGVGMLKFKEQCVVYSKALFIFIFKI